MCGTSEDQILQGPHTVFLFFFSPGARAAPADDFMSFLVQEREQFQWMIYDCERMKGFQKISGAESP